MLHYPTSRRSCGSSASRRPSPRKLKHISVIDSEVIRSHYVVSADAQRFLLAAPRGGEALSGSNVIVNWAAEVWRR